MQFSRAAALSVVFQFFLVGGASGADTPQPSEDWMARSDHVVDSPGRAAELTGSYNQDIPIEVPDYHDLEPKLALQYDSLGGLGHYGRGWGLSGASVIERVSPGKGAPNHDSADIFLLNGVELVADTSLGGTHNTKVKRFQRITRNTVNNTWTVITTDGTQRLYAAVLNVSGTTIRWGLSTVTDTNGNTVNYTYWCDGADDCYLDRITYNGTTVTFHRETRADTPSFGGGGPSTANVLMRYRIKTIDVQVGAARARAYKLGYTDAAGTVHSMLTSVQMYGTDAVISSGTITGGTAMPAVTTAYSTATTGVNASTNVVVGPYYSQGRKYIPFSMDVNGDGKTDLVRVGSAATGTNAEVRVYLATGSTLSATAVVTQVGPYLDLVANAYESLAMDVDGDGKFDLVRIGYGSGGLAEVRVYRSTGTGSFTYNGSSTAGSFYWQGATPMNLAMDVDGDGRTDLVRIGLASGAVNKEAWVYRSNGTTMGTPQGPTTLGAAQVQGVIAKHFAMDINGDGRSDILRVEMQGSGTNEQAKVFLANGTGGFTAIAGATPLNIFASQAIFTANYAMDINGDGRTDLVRVSCTGATNVAEARVYLSTGRSFGAGSVSTATVGACIGGNEKVHNFSMDLNGDGRTDLVRVAYEGVNDVLRVYLATGVGFSAVQATNTVGTHFAQGDAYAYLVMDVNGDGKSDFVKVGVQASGTNVEARIHQSTGLRPELLTTFNNGLGSTATITYSPSSGWTNTLLPTVLMAVTSISTTDGRGNTATRTYSYEGGLWSFTERTFFGYRKITEVLDAAGTKREVLFHQHVNCNHSVETEHLKNSAGNIFWYRSYTYSETGTGPYTSLVTDDWTYECNLTASCRSQLTQYSYDVYGNRTQVKQYGNYASSGDELLTVSSFVPNTTAFVVGLPSYTNAYAGLTTSDPMVQQALFYYDGATSYTTAPVKGNMTRRSEWLASGNANTYLTYDSYGNVLTETDPIGAVTTFTWDTTYRVYQTEVCNALGRCTQSAWNTTLGVKTSETDPNSRVLSFTHDVLGRPLRTTYPNGGFSEKLYVNIGSPTTQYVETRASDGSADLLWSREYRDGLGRTYKETREGGYTKDTTYFADRPHKASHKSAWYGSGETAKFDVFAYDGAGRLTTTTHADGTVDTNLYGVGTVTTRDPLNHERIYDLDMWGRITRVQEKLGATYYATTYAYDALGRLTTVTNAASKQSTNTWDPLGRRTQACDPDLGCWTYTYDLAGNQLTQLDARGQTITLTYDLLGRMLTRRHPDASTFTWVYDEAGHGDGIGRPTTITYPAGSESLTYDFDGRVTSHTRWRGGSSYTIATTYDTTGKGRLTSVVYPDETVSYTYNAAGELSSVGGYATSITHNARGQLVSLSLSNGRTESYAYNVNNYRLTQTKLLAGVTALYQADYVYANDGQITSMTVNNGTTSTVNFAYDDLHRLTTVSGAQSQTLAYNSVGNITSNSLVGTYTYGDPAHAHAVTAAGTNTYTYDQNGNMISGAGRTLTYDAENRPVSITKSGVTVTMDYDAVGVRARKIAPALTTSFFGKYLELEGSTLQKYVYLGDRRLARRAALGTKYFFHQDHLSSVRAMTDGGGTVVKRYDFRPFGSVFSETGTLPNNRRFTGHFHDDETGLIDMEARFYDPVLSRFITPDLVVPGAENPQALNRYSYVLNNPLAYNDPTGHEPEPGSDRAPHLNLDGDGIVSLYVAGIRSPTVSPAYIDAASQWLGAGIDRVIANRNHVVSAFVQNANNKETWNLNWVVNKAFEQNLKVQIVSHSNGAQALYQVIKDLPDKSISHITLVEPAIRGSHGRTILNEVARVSEHSVMVASPSDYAVRLMNTRGGIENMLDHAREQGIETYQTVGRSHNVDVNLRQATLQKAARNGSAHRGGSSSASSGKAPAKRGNHRGTNRGGGSSSKPPPPPKKKP